MATSPYQARVAPGGTARFGQASEAAFGAQFGEAVSHLGDTLQRVERNEENAKTSLALEQLKADTEEYERALRDGTSPDAKPGAAGHVALASKFWDDRFNALADGIGDRRLREIVDLRGAEYRRRLVDSAATFEAAKRVEKLGRDNRDAVGVIANRARFMDDPQKLADALDSYDLQVEGYTGLSPDQADAMRKEGHDAIRLSFLRGQTDRNPAAARALIERGAFDDLDPKLIDGELSAIGVEERRQQAEVDARARLEKADAKEQIDLFLKAGNDGVPQSREDFARIKGLIGQYDLAKDGYDVAKLETEFDVRAETRPMLPAQISAALNTVEARIAQAGDKASPQDIWRRDELKRRLGERRSQIANDPYGYAAQNGIAVAPLDLTDPKSVANRKRVRGQLVSATGNADISLFQPDELPHYTMMAKGSPAQRRQLVDELSRIGAVDAYREIRHIAPQDMALQGALAIPPPYRPFVFDGEERLAANSALFQKAEFETNFNSEVQSSLRGLGPVAGTSTIEVAKRIYASLAAQSGDTEFDKGRFWWSVHMALGGDRTGGVQRGGVGEWNDSRMLLPSGMTQQDFDTRLSRVGRIDAVWADGHPITPSELRKSFVPVAIADGVYRFEGRGGVVRSKSGGVFTIDIRKEGR